MANEVLKTPKSTMQVVTEDKQYIVVSKTQ